MFAQVKTLVGGVDDYGILVQAAFFQVVQHLTHALVHGGDGAKVVLHISLVSPLHEGFVIHAFLVPLLKIGGDGLVVLVPLGPLLGVHAAYFALEAVDIFPFFQI